MASSSGDDGGASSYEHLNNESSLFGLQLQISDLTRLQARISTKRTTPKDKDVRTAATVQRGDFEAVRRTILDRRMAQSIQDAVTSDPALIAANAKEEEIARRDRELARQLEEAEDSDDEVPDLPQPPFPESQTSVNTDMLARLAGLFVSESASKEISSGIRSLFRPLDQRPMPFRQALEAHECVICGDLKSHYEVTQVSCQHYYCRDCLRELFEKSYKDETLFPPRCCGKNINVLGNVSLFLPRELEDPYRLRKIEVATKDKTYCADPACAKFMVPDTIKHQFCRCDKCGKWTCSKCKRPAHDGMCPRDKDLAAMEALAKREGWKKCGSCERMIELDRGCNHMTYISTHAPENHKLTLNLDSIAATSSATSAV